VVANTDPEYPALQVQPLTTSVPELFAGQLTELQVDSALDAAYFPAAHAEQSSNEL
jgi:hypothetical protein